MKPYLAGYCSRSEESGDGSSEGETGGSEEATDGGSSVSEEVEEEDDSEGQLTEEGLVISEKEANDNQMAPDESVSPSGRPKRSRNPPRWQEDYVVLNDQESSSPHSLLGIARGRAKSQERPSVAERPVVSLTARWRGVLARRLERGGGEDAQKDREGRRDRQLGAKPREKKVVL
ncbi:hypothetical protein OUZ56_029966 [Daphnia magna]|uniref:Uncharacterized protein n=1 Tax=Daphnia magna TaxID=35525 RepID=A0ABR0B8A9_9CRUS|nr:hypothetical protein OUZ56_029966 [Daphnia magna]